eukprot:8150038-Lingulodinium_polyedra.AAC.1
MPFASGPKRRQKLRTASENRRWDLGTAPRRTLRKYARNPPYGAYRSGCGRRRSQRSLHARSRPP